VIPFGDGPDPGDPERAAVAAVRVASHLRVVAEGLDAAADVYPAWSAVSWSGLAAFEVRRIMLNQPRRFRAVATAFRSAAEALSHHAAQLQAADRVLRAAGRAPVAAAPGLLTASQSMVAASAHAVASRLSELAASAPSRPSFAARVAERVEDWHDEVAVGAGESTAAVAGLVVRGAGMLDGAFSARTVAEARTAARALGDLAARPGTTAKALVDWDTWATDPPRAVGHLLPDLFGGAGGAHAARSLAAGRNLAARAAAARRLADEEATALAARDRLRSSARRGPEGSRLPGASVAVVARYHALSMAAEARVTAVLQRIAAEAGASLEGLPTRRKTLESTLRKAARNPGPVRLAELHDLVRYTVVAGTRHYTATAGRVGHALVEQGFRPARAPWNAWAASSRYRGLNTTWIDPVSGVTFEVQFHTPGTWKATRVTHPLYEKMRVLDDAAARAPFEAAIRSTYATVRQPAGATWWRAGTYPPAPGWLTPDPVPVHGRAAATAGALAPALAPVVTPAGRPSP
jgi:hypothetical protein